MEQTLLTTKLVRPPLPPQLVVRSRLLAQFEASVQRPLTLVSAPAGFGKTLLVASWLQQTNHPVAWLSIDDNDSEPLRFWTYVDAAFHNVLPDIGLAAQEALHTSPAPTVEALVALLINDLARHFEAPSPEPPTADHLFLVLDDYHLIEAAAIHEGVTFLLDHCPPWLHLILITRSDPPLALARRRARRELLELRAADLRFTVEETTTFLHQSAGLTLSPEDTALLTNRTEGWIASLHMAALSLQHHSDPTAFIRDFSGNDRYIVDYLLDEVLSQQPPAVQQFLLQTAVLQRLNAPLCDALVDTTLQSPPVGNDHTPLLRQFEVQGSQAMLEYLERANLFLIALDNQRHWYRFHRLFADLLRQRAQLHYGAAFIKQQHQRASAWYEAQDYLDDAMQHAIASNNTNRMIELLARYRGTLLARAEWSTLTNWVHALPVEIRQREPHLLIGEAWTLIRSIDLERITALLDRAETLLQRGEHAYSEATVLTLSGEISGIRGLVSLWQSDFVRTIELSEAALARLPADRLPMRGYITLNIGHAYRALRQIDRAREAFQAASEISAANGSDIVSQIALISLAHLHTRQGDLPATEQTLQQAIALATTSNGQLRPAGALPCISLGVLYYEWDRLDDAEEAFRLATQLGQRSGLTRAIADSKLYLAYIAQVRGDATQAQQIMAEAQRVFEPLKHPLADIRFRSYETRLLLMQGKLAAAAEWVTPEVANLDEPLGDFNEFIYAALLRVWIMQGQLQGDQRTLQRALTLTQRLRQEAIDTQQTGLLIEIDVLRALALHAHNERQHALALLTEVIALAEPAGYTRLFIDLGQPMALLLRQLLNDPRTAPQQRYIRQLLQTFTPNTLPIPPEPASHLLGASAAPTPLVETPLIEPLSSRELEILRLIADGHAVADIAAELIVSVHTVRTHIRNIYRKLDVHGRVQAIQKARQLGLL